MINGLIGDIRETEEGIFSRLLLNQIVDSLANKYKAIVSLRMAKYTQKEAGIILGVTRAGAGAMEKRAMQLMVLKATELTQEGERNGNSQMP